MPLNVSFPDGYCDGENLSNPVVTEIVSISEYRDAHVKFDSMRSQRSLTELVAYANFLPSTIQTLLDRNPNAKFIRVFNGIRPAGDYPHFMFMTAVDSNAKVIDSIIIENCCQCPPRCQIMGGF